MATEAMSAPESLAERVLILVDRISQDGAILLLNPEDYKKLIGEVATDTTKLPDEYFDLSDHGKNLTIFTGGLKLLVEKDVRIKQGAVHLCRKMT